jgi:YD repeat-containing protein
MAACEKELSSTNHHDSNITDSQELLVKTIDESPGGSIITEYAYDQSSKLISERTTMTNTSVGTRTSSMIFYRDPQGRIIKTAHKYDQPVENILYDTVITLVHYENQNSTKILYTTAATTANGITVYDSTLYSYNASNKVIKTQHYTYRSNEPLGTPRKKSNWFSWDYNSVGNLIKMEQYSDPAGNGAYQVDITYTFEYDNKINPYYSGDDIRLEGDWYSASPNNVVKQTVHITQTREQYDNRISYDQYDASGRPKIATHTPAFAPVINTKFFYQ